MAKRLTLHTLAENLIRESRVPFTAEEYVRRIQERWRRRIAPSTLNDLRDKLSNHDYLIHNRHYGFIPYQAVLDHVGNVPLYMMLGKLELGQKILVPGHRLIPFIAPELSENDLTFLDPAGRKIPDAKKSFFIEEVIHLYQYSNERHFPDQIEVNQWMPGKSALNLTVWDIGPLVSENALKAGDAVKIRLVDYDQGVFTLEPYRGNHLREDRLRLRSVHVKLENALLQECEKPEFLDLGLEKQIFQVLYALDKNDLDFPAFSLSDFVESLRTLTLTRSETAGIHFAPAAGCEVTDPVWEVVESPSRGSTQSLDAIFQDMGLAFSEKEFKAILYSVMASEDFDIEFVFSLLFGAKKDRFHDKRQHNAFYRMLRKMLTLICDELKGPEPRVVSQIRNQAVDVKLRLIEILRFLESNGANLEDLPEELLNQLADLDHFCEDTLHRLADRPKPPDLKTIRDIRMALKVVRMNLEQLEEDFYFRLGIY